MRLKLKALGLAALAVLAVCAIGVMNAAATSGGHFVTDVTGGHALIKVLEKNNHHIEFTFHGLSGGVVCDSVVYHGETFNATESEITMEPTYFNCHTTNEIGNTVPIDDEGCEFRFTVTPEGEKETVNGTVDLVCPGSGLTITHKSCWARIPSQFSLGGVSYKTIIENNKHAITVEANIQVSVKFEAGACTLLGTNNHTGTFAGSATMIAGDTAGNSVNITAT